MAKKPTKTSATESTGNLFADLGITNSEQELVKARLTLQIYRIIRERGPTHVEAAEVLV